ncbi:Cytochrome P450 4C1 [Orchesella cincta]|uniref:Cytochrome P450 4C1 n=1 Tax=Orchesella cincta TaxID=48709 RepID=A0A1D2MX26_ORCCI|nr:Cytochrome P450 4C1 [Orchesella cincta]
METNFVLVYPYSGKALLSEFLLVFTVFLSVLKLVQVFGQNGKRKKWDKFDGLAVDPYKAYKALPGPRPFPIRLIGNVLSFVSKTGALNKFVEFAKKYGPCYRLVFFGEDYVVLNTPSAAQAIMLSTDPGHFRRGAIEEMLWPEDMEGLLIYTGEKWKARKKMLTRPFLYKALQLHNPCFYKQCGRMIKQLEERFSNGSIQIVDDLLKQAIFRMSSEILMGVDLSETGDDAIFCESLETFMSKSFDRVFRPWLFVKWIWYRSSQYRETQHALRAMEKVTKKVFKKYREKLELEKVLTVDSENNVVEEIPNDLSYTMIEVMLRHGLTEKQILDEVAVMLLVANDTTSVAVEYALFMLAVHQEHQEICRQEVDAVFNDPSKNKNGILDFEALKELKYLERCIQESQRIHPLGSTMRTLDTPLRINEELVIPPDVSVFVLAHVLHHNPEYFPNPEKFDPDRFLPEQVRARHNYAYIPFTHGPRACLGMKLALLELKVMVSTILRNFEVSTPDRREDVKAVIEGIVKPAKPIRFTFKKRHGV